MAGSNPGTSTDLPNLPGEACPWQRPCDQEQANCHQSLCPGHWFEHGCQSSWQTVGPGTRIQQRRFMPISGPFPALHVNRLQNRRNAGSLVCNNRLNIIVLRHSLSDDPHT
jgi:hypothetical protein